METIETVLMVKYGQVETVAVLEECFFIADGWHRVEGAAPVAVVEEAPVEAHE